MTQGGWRDDDLDAAVHALAGATTLAFGGVGFAGTLLPETEAYLLLQQAHGGRADQVRAGLDWLLRHGSPAGRAYAATLLDRVDPVAGRAAWRVLATTDDDLTTFSGCLVGSVPLADYARERIEGRESGDSSPVR